MAETEFETHWLINKVHADTTHLPPDLTRAFSGSHDNPRDIVTRDNPNGASRVYAREDDIEGPEIERADTQEEKYKKSIIN